MPAGGAVVLAGAMSEGLRAGLEDATAQVQALIDATPANGTLELPRGTYLVSKPIIISKPMTLTTEGSDEARRPVDPLAGGELDLSQFATLRASPSLVFGFSYPARDQDKGLLVVRPPEGQGTLSDVHIRHIALDGNGSNRGSDRFGSDQFNCSNLNMQRTDNSSFTDSVSFDATGRGWDPYSHIFVDCNNLKINDNLLIANGEIPIGADAPGYFVTNFATNTLEVQAQTRDVRVEIEGNRIHDATNLGIVLQTGPGRTMTGEVAYNEILQFRYMNYGVGLLLYGQGSFGDGRLQDPRTTMLVHHNVIDGNAGRATIPGTSTRIRQIPYGILVGVGPFGNPPEFQGFDVWAWHITGGRIYKNEIRNVQVGIGVDQAGTLASPAYIVNNKVGGSTGLAYNKAPQDTPGYLPNVIVANTATAPDGRGGSRQVGKMKLFSGNSKPASWSALFTRGTVAYGLEEPVRRLITAAPKPFPSPPRGRARSAVRG